MGCEELQAITSKAPSLWSLRCTNTSHQHQAGAGMLWSHHPMAAAGLQALTFHHPPKHPESLPDMPWVPAWVPCGSALSWVTASSRQDSSWPQGTATSIAGLTGQLRPVKQGSSSKWDSQVLSGQMLLQTTKERD